MSQDRLDQLAADVHRLIERLETLVRERDQLRARVAELGSQDPRPAAAAPPAAGLATSGDDDALMEHVELLESERSQVRERLTRLLRRLEEVDLVE